MKDSQQIYKLLKRIASPEESLLAHEELAMVIKCDWASIVPELSHFLELSKKNNAPHYDNLCHWAAGVFGRLLRSPCSTALEETPLNHLRLFLKSESAMVRRYAAIQLLWSGRESEVEGCLQQDDLPLFRLAQLAQNVVEKEGKK